MSTALAPSTAPKAAATAATNGKKTIKALLEGDAFKNAVAKTLPKHLKADRFIRVAILAMQRTPKLAKCTEASFFNCLMQLSSLGLEPDGRMAHLIPFDNRKEGTTECTLIVDWKGLKELVLRTGLISYVHADVVCEGDLIDYNAGELRSHVPWFLRRDEDKPEEEGEVFAAYALARMKDGSTQCVVMSTGEIENIRQRSKSKDSGPWMTDLNEMRKKTAFRRLAKWLPMSPEIRDAVEAGDDVIDIPGKPTLAQVDAAGFLSASTQAPDPEDEPEALPEPAPTKLPTTNKAEPVHASVRPAPVEEKTEGASTAMNPIKAIRGLLKIAGVTEPALMQFLRSSGAIDESLSSLEEIQMAQPTALALTIDNWASIEASLKGAAK